MSFLLALSRLIATQLWLRQILSEPVSMDEVQIGIALVVIYLLHRWWSSSSSGSSAPSNASGPSSRDPIAAAADRYNALAATIPASSIEQASAMFPQFDDRHLRWEFVRTGRVRTLEQLAQGLLDDRAPPPPPVGLLHVTEDAHTALMLSNTAPSIILARPASFQKHSRCRKQLGHNKSESRQARIAHRQVRLTSTSF